MRSATDPGTVQRLFGSSPSLGLLLIRSLWPAMVGPEIARRTEVVALQDRMLRVRVADSRWMRVLHRMQRMILNRLARQLGAVAPNQIGFVEGRLSSPITAPRIRPLEELRDAAPPEKVKTAAMAIKDPELRRRFMETAARYLRQRRPR